LKPGCLAVPQVPHHLAAYAQWVPILPHQVGMRVSSSAPCQSKSRMFCNLHLYYV